MGTSSFLVVRDMAKVTNMWGSWSVCAGGCCLLKCYWSTSGIGELTCVWECSSWFLIWEGARKLGGSNTYLAPQVTEWVLLSFKAPQISPEVQISFWNAGSQWLSLGRKWRRMKTPPQEALFQVWFAKRAVLDALLLSSLCRSRTEVGGE